MDDILIIGYGDIGRRVAAVYKHRSCPVSALIRNDTVAAALSAQGVGIYIGDLDQPDCLPELPTVDSVVFYFAPPPGQGESDPRLQAILDRIPNKALPRKIVYISSSAVYGDCRGAWVTENTPPKPNSARARRRLAAETLLHDWERTTGVAVAILRVGGIYGPGRLPVERLRQGLSVLREAECVYSNRIHADDLATVCIAAADRGRGIYNVSDGHPGTITDYFNKVADLYGLPRPRQIGIEEARAQLSTEMMSYLEESRRLDNRRILNELGVHLSYPTLSAGLANCAAMNGRIHTSPSRP